MQVVSESVMTKSMCVCVVCVVLLQACDILDSIVQVVSESMEPALRESEPSYPETNPKTNSNRNPNPPQPQPTILLAKVDYWHE